MKFSIEKDDLLKALGHVQSIVEKRNTIPILGNIRMEVGESHLHLNATDMELEISETVPVKTIAPGKTTVPAHVLFDYIRRLEEGAEVTFETISETRVKVSAGEHSGFDLNTLPVDDFPLMSEIDTKAHRFEIEGFQLARLLDRTKFAMANEEARYYLNGIFLHQAEARQSKNPVLRAVSTDGHRLALADTPLPKGAEGLASIIIPRKTVNELYKLLETEKDSENPIKIAVSENRISFELSSTILISRLIDGNFPDYERVIPQQEGERLLLPVQPFIRAVERVSVISNDRNRIVKVSLRDTVMTLETESADTGIAKEQMEVSWNSQSSVEIGFNIRYLLDAIAQLEGDTLELSLLDNSSQTIVREPGDESVLFILMPMRV